MIQVKKENEIESPYPKLMALKNKGGVFLFISKREAVCLDGILDNWKIGEYSNDVNIEDFVIIKESITIKNV